MEGDLSDFSKHAREAASGRGLWESARLASWVLCYHQDGAGPVGVTIGCVLGCMIGHAHQEAGCPKGIPLRAAGQ